MKIEKIEQGTIVVSGVDLLDGTPIYDIKPYIPYSDCVSDAMGSFAEDNKNHKLEVVFPEKLLALIPKDKQKDRTFSALPIGLLIE